MGRLPDISIKFDQFRDFLCYQTSRGDRGIEVGVSKMESEKVAGILGAIVAAAALVTAIAFGPIGQFGKPQKPVSKMEAQPAAPPPSAVRGPVIREVPQ
jgi:hypothetical protein